jgi:hypothetical protein
MTHQPMQEHDIAKSFLIFSPRDGNDSEIPIDLVSRTYRPMGMGRLRDR